MGGVRNKAPVKAGNNGRAGAKRRDPATPSRADRNIAWIERYCFVPEGKDRGKPVVLRNWQRRDLRKIYDNPFGTRTAIISFGKKNGKTSLAAFLLLLHLCGPEALPNSGIPSTAQSRDQAAILFGLAGKVVRMSPDLSRVVNVRETRKELYCAELGTLYRALSSETSTAQGLSPPFAVHDELGQVRGPVSELYTAIENAMGAHERPLSIIISTQAPTDGDLLSKLIDYAETGADPTIVLSLYVAGDEVDPFSVKAIRQANPAYGDFLNPAEVKRQAKNAKALPSQESLYRNYTLNQRVDKSTPFISKSVWQRNGAAPARDWGQAEVYSGLDLAATNDLTAHVAIAQTVPELWDVKPTFWLPGESLRAKARADAVPYDLWNEAGFLETTPGLAIEYEFVAKQLFEFDRTHNWKRCAFDRWGMKYLRPWLIKAGFSESRIDSLFVEFGQGFRSFSPALRDEESILLQGKARHGDHPVLAFCAANAVVTTDPAGGRKLNKAKSAGRIDGLVALTMAFGVAPIGNEPAPAVDLDEWVKAVAV
jgi:phage terminase large subunit-like protein